MAPQYPYGGNVGAGNAYKDAIRQTQLDADAARKIIERGGTPTRMAAQSPGFLQRLKGIKGPAGLAILGSLIDATRIPGDMQEARDEGRDPNRALVESLSGIGLGGLLSAVNSAFVAEPGDPLLSPMIVGYKSYEGGDEMGRKGARKFLNFVLGEEEITNNDMSNQEGYDGYRGPGGAPDSGEMTDAELAALNETIQPIVPESVNPPAPVPPRVESGSSAALPGRDSVLSTPNNMQSELLKEATTMRRAKEMKELGITGGDEAMNKGSKMYKWLSIHGDMADNLIRDKRMREVRLAREFDRDLPIDARGLDGQMGNFEAFREIA